MSADQLFNDLRSKIDELRSRENQVATYDGVLRFISIALILTTLAGLSEWLLNFEPAGRWVMVIVWLSATAAAFGWWALLPVLRWMNILPSHDDVTLAKKAGERFPAIKDQLANAIQIYRQHATNIYSESLMRAALQDIHHAVAHIDLRLAVNYNRIKKTLKQAGAVAGLTVIIFFVLYQPLTGAFGRLLNPSKHFDSLAPFNFVMVPGDAEILHGDDARMTIRLQRKDSSLVVLPDRLSLYVRTSGVENYTEETLKADSIGVFYHTIKNIRQPVFYYAEAVDKSFSKSRKFRSDEYKIQVVKRPGVKRLEVEIQSPGYSKIDHRVLDENTGDIVALKGSRVKLKIEASKSLQSAAIIFSDSSVAPLKIGAIAPSKAEGVFVLTRGGSYHIELTDQDQVKSSNPVEYQLSVIPDEYPEVKLVYPEKDMDINEEMTMSLAADIQDDFGVSKLLLHHKLDQTSGIVPPQEDYSAMDISFLIDREHVNQSIFYNWNFGDLNLQPEDVISFYLEVFDNDAVSGPKSAKSQIIRLRFPSLEEILAEANKEQDQALSKAEELVKESEDLKKSLEEINQDLLKDKKLDWKDKEKIKELTQKQEKMQREIKEMQENLDKLAQKMNENNVLSKETMEKYQELQKLLSEINSKELQDAMQKMQEAMRNNFDPNMLKEALKDFKFDQQSFKQSVERTVELLKRIKAEQMFDQLKKQAEDLKRRQDQINELSKDVKNENEKNALAKEQERLKESLNDMERKSEELKDLVGKIDKNFKTQELDKAIDQMKNGSTQKKMDESKQAITQNQQNQQPQKENQQQISKDLDSLAQQLSKAQQEYREQQDSQIMNAMRKIIFDMLETSKEQEAVMNDARSLMSFSPRYSQMTQRQADVRTNMGRVTENLIDLSNNTFFVTTALGKLVASALNDMNDAVKDLEERNTVRALGKQNQAMGSINEAVKMLLQSMDKMQNGQSGTGLQQLMEELQNMAGQQGQLNEQTLPFGQNSGKLSMEQQAQLGRMMAEQQALKESLENMQGQLEGQQDLKNKLGNMVKEMDEVIKDMAQQKVDRKTIERQQKILQRMLDATRSTQEKDFSEKRKGETGKDYRSKSPNELPSNLTDRKAKLRQDLLKILREGYSKDYEELIKKYFEALGNVAEGEKEK